MDSTSHISSIFRWTRVSKAVVSLLMLITVAMPMITPFVAYAQTTPPPNPGNVVGGINGQPPVAQSILAGCSFSLQTSFSTCLAAIVYFFFIGITGFIAPIAGYFFDFATAISLTGPTYASNFIANAWSIARDLANMMFVFLLIYLAFTLILNVSSAGAGKQLAKITAVALLINFSFFFTRLIIDASNIASHAFYDAISGRVLQADGATAGGNPLQVKTLSENIMSGINVQRLMSDRGEGSFSTFLGTLQRNGHGFTNFILLSTIFIMFGVMNIILIFIFIAVGIQMIGRIVRLWLVIMLAPIGFITWIVPGLSSISSRWWNTLLQSAFFAPAFMLGIYITIRVSLGSCNGSECEGGLLSGLSVRGNVGDLESMVLAIMFVVIRLAIVAGMLFASLKIGDYFGQTSAKAVVSNARKYGGDYALKGAGYFAARSVGAGANAVDRGLKNSRVGNTLAGYKFRQYVAQPLAKQKFFGAESYKDRTLRVNKERAERDAGRARISNFEALDPAKDAATWGQLGEERQNQIRATAQKMSGQDLEDYGIKNLPAIAHLLSGKQVDELQKGVSEGKYTNSEIGAVKTAFNGRIKDGMLGSKDAAINKIDSDTQKIRDTEAIRARIGLKQHAAIDKLTDHTQAVTSTDIENAHEAYKLREIEINNELNEIRNAPAGETAAQKVIRTQRRAELSDMQNQTRDRIKGLEKIKEESEKLGAGAGAHSGNPNLKPLPGQYVPFPVKPPAAGNNPTPPPNAGGPVAPPNAGGNNPAQPSQGGIAGGAGTPPTQGFRRPIPATGRISNNPAGYQRATNPAAGTPYMRPTPAVTRQPRVQNGSPSLRTSQESFRGQSAPISPANPQAVQQIVGGLSAQQNSYNITTPTNNTAPQANTQSLRDALSRTVGQQGGYSTTPTGPAAPQTPPPPPQNQ